jgi:hypothetical protein
MTLFAPVSPEHEVFQMVLDKFFHGQEDQKTIGFNLFSNFLELTNMLILQMKCARK